MDIKIDEKLKSTLPNLSLHGFCCKVKTKATNEELKAFIDSTISKIQNNLQIAEIRNIESINETKKAYKLVGKDPNRYRPAAESLLRRVCNNKGLYLVNNVVDVLNIASLTSAYSICAYKKSSIIGDIVFGIGRSGEEYEGIGRGQLNIENLMVFRDSIGAFGSPTSDSERTKIDTGTDEIVVIVPSFSLSNKIDECIENCIKLVGLHAEACDVKTFKI